MKSILAALFVHPAFIASIFTSPVHDTLRGEVLAPRQPLTCVVLIIDLVADIALPRVASQASSFCSEFIEQTRTVSQVTTVVQTNRISSTVARTATITTTITSAAPTVTDIVYANCNINGYDAGIAAYRSDTTANSFSACKALCTSDTGCASFAISSDNCLLYRAPVLSNTNPVPSSPYTFFDRNCPSPSNALARRAAPSSTPVFFVAVPTAVLSTVCTCIITKAPTTTTSLLWTTSVTQDVVSLITKTVATVVQTVGTAAAPTTVTITTTV